MVLCAICGDSRTEGAHVKAKEWWEGRLPANHRDFNIIPLCPNHHKAFDKDHTIGIAKDKSGFAVLAREGLMCVRSLENISAIRDEYVAARNATCRLQVQLGLGIVPGYADHKICG